MYPSSPEINPGINPFVAMTTLMLIVGQDATTCGSCGEKAPSKANVCVHCGVVWMFVAVDYRQTDETTFDMGMHVRELRPGFVFVGLVGGSYPAGYYLAESCMIAAKLTWRLALRRLYLELRRKDETR